jgi:hypothetical protein
VEAARERRERARRRFPARARPLLLRRRLVKATEPAVEGCNALEAVADRIFSSL